MAEIGIAASTIIGTNDGSQTINIDSNITQPTEIISDALIYLRASIFRELLSFLNRTTNGLNGTPNPHITEERMPVIVYSSTSPIILDEKNCSQAFRDFNHHNIIMGKHCNWTWDQFLCWPPTPADTLAQMRCPPVGHGIDITKYAERSCLKDGHWAGKPNETQYNPHGWTNYTPCFKPDVISLMQQFYSGGNSEIKFAIAESTRTLEIVGLMISLFALLLSLFIFCYFRSLRNNRTKIHKNLFVAMVVQVVIRLTLYLDQAIIRGNREWNSRNDLNGIENTPYVCEASYVLLEYARTAMFMWMFIEGLYLHNVVTVSVFQGRFPHAIYSIIGWGAPVIMTAFWAAVTAHYKSNESCWWNYNLTPYYWILEGPRLTVILLNFFFLMNIIRVLIVKLRQSQTSDLEQVRKAVRATAFLLPLLGITNLLHIIQAPINRTALEFALWSYVTHFLTSLQGFFIALIYCFLNGEVRAVLLKSFTVYMSLRGHSEWIPRRASMFSAGCNTAPDTEAAVHDSTRADTSPHRSTQNDVNKDKTKHCAEQEHKYRQYTHLQSPPNHKWYRRNNGTCMTLCFRRQHVLRVPVATPPPPESVILELSEQ